MREFGKKGGKGPTADRLAKNYVAIAPDGSVLKKRSFFVSFPTAYIMAYELSGKWRAAAVTTDPKEFPQYKALEAQLAPPSPRRNAVRA